MTDRLTHLDETGAAKMVDVSDKPVTSRTAQAEGFVVMKPETLALIQDAVVEVFDLRPAAIIRDLDLLRPIYSQTAAYGHFGRPELDFTWESTARAQALANAIK